MSSLDSGNFTIKFNKTKLYALSKTYNSIIFYTEGVFYS